MLIPVILCGGSGTRLWPLSRAAYPKQLLPLINEKSLLQNTCLRAKAITDTPLIIICNEQYRFIVAQQLHDIGIQNATILLEPCSKNTAVAIAACTHYIQQRIGDAIMWFMPSDHYFADHAPLKKSILSLAKKTNDNNLSIVGIKATTANTSYGYIQYTNNIGNGIYQVDKFIEKPPIEMANTLLTQGKVLWNAGLFLLSTQSAHLHFSTLAKEINHAANKAVDKAQKDMDFIRLAQEPYETVEAIPFDIAIVEKAKNVQVFLLDTHWHDIGQWQALTNVLPKDSQGNTTQGSVISSETKNCFIHAENRLVATCGVDDLVIVETKDAVLVSQKSSTSQVKNIVEQLKKNKQPEAYFHQTIYRPWGHYELLDTKADFKVKRIVVNPKQSLSLQAHQYRSEHWIVVKGLATVECDDKKWPLKENMSCYIPKGAKHRLSNETSALLEIIEVQVGHYLGEDDIIRFSDVYGRINQSSEEEQS